MGSTSSTVNTSDICLEDRPALAAATLALQNRLTQGGGDLSFEKCVECFTLYKQASTTVAYHFPGGKDVKDILDATVKAMNKHNCNKNNTLFAHSLCPDQMINENINVASLFEESFGKGFHLGGLAGIPFTGKTGFASFSHNVADDGNLFILMAPHIGISESGQLGKYSRLGCECDEAACGAVIGALHYCMQQDSTHKDKSLSSHPFDYQMDFIKSEIGKKYLEINTYDDPNKIMAATVSVIYDISKQFLESIVHTDFGNKTGKLVILAGIQINMPPPMIDYFQPLMFEIREHEKPAISLMDETFPNWLKQPCFMDNILLKSNPSDSNTTMTDIVSMIDDDAPVTTTVVQGSGDLNILSDSREWFIPLDYSNSYACCIMSLDMPRNTTINDAIVVLNKISLLFSTDDHFGQYTIHPDVIYNPANHMRETIHIKLIDYCDDLLNVKKFIENNVDFRSETVDIVLDGSYRMTHCANPEMDTLTTDILFNLDWTQVVDSHDLSSYTHSLVSGQGDFVMFGPTYDYVNRLWLRTVSLWILHSKPTARHFMYQPNEKRVGIHKGIPVQHFFGNLQLQNVSKTDIGLRKFWSNTDIRKEFYVGNAMYTSHPSKYTEWSRKATIGPSVRSICPDLPHNAIPTNWFISAAHTFAESNTLTDGSVVPPIPKNAPIYDVNDKIIGKYIVHDSSQCIAIVQITSKNMLNKMKVTHKDTIDIVGSNGDIDIGNMLSRVWKENIYKSGATTGTTRGDAYSFGSKLNVKYSGGKAFDEQHNQFLMVQGLPVSATERFSDAGDSGSGVYLINKINDSTTTACVFGTLEGGMNVTASVAPFCSAIQPINVHSLQSLVLRTIKYRYALIKSIESASNHSNNSSKSVVQHIAKYIADHMNIGWQSIVAGNLMHRQSKTIAAVKRIAIDIDATRRTTIDDDFSSEKDDQYGDI